MRSRGRGGVTRKISQVFLGLTKKSKSTFQLPIRAVFQRSEEVGISEALGNIKTISENLNEGNAKADMPSNEPAKENPPEKNQIFHQRIMRKISESSISN